MSCSSQLISNLYTSRKTLLELSEIRGFDTSKHSNFSTNEIRVMFSEKQLDFDLEGKGDNSKKAFVRYLITTKIRNNSLKNYISDFLEMNEDFEPDKSDIIIILKDKPNESLLKVVDDFYNENQIYINLFYIKSLMFNILNHEYVPDHKIISEENFKELKQNYSINSRLQLPLLSKHDAVSTALGIRPGDIVKITRPSKTAGQYVSYRCCK